tara:strand:- start:6893 stop:7327 length:435 start_codon:yes stop_codon:yes gene_type:complete
MKKILLFTLLALLISFPAEGQREIYQYVPIANPNGDSGQLSMANVESISGQIQILGSTTSGISLNYLVGTSTETLEVVPIAGKNNCCVSPETGTVLVANMGTRLLGYAFEISPMNWRSIKFRLRGGGSDTTAKIHLKKKMMSRK